MAVNFLGPEEESQTTQSKLQMVLVKLLSVVAAAPDAVSGEIFSSSTPSLIQSTIAVFISTEW